MDIVSLIPAFGGFLTTILAFVVALSVIVAVHEYGHYIVGRWGGIKAEVFSLGFGPVLISRVDKHGTRWQLAALPFGGYVKFKGDTNAASVGEDNVAVDAMSAEARRQTVQGAPLLARTAMVAAGPVFNFILSIIVFAGIGFSAGVVKEPLTVGKMAQLPQENSLRTGDEIVSIGGQTVPAFDDPAFAGFTDSLPKEPELNYVVRRDGQEVELRAPYPLATVVSGLSAQSAAYNAGIEVDDVITTVEGEPVFAFSQLVEAVLAANGKPLALGVWRNGEILEMSLAPRRMDEPQPEGGFKTIWRIGIHGGFLFDPATEIPDPWPAFVWESVVNGTARTGDLINSSISGLYHMITGGISTCNMTGPIGIAQVSGAMASQGTQSFVFFIAVLSTAVGLLNLFPIPVLDGGHLVFFGYEALTGRPPSDRAMRLLMGLGLTIILSTMVFALTNDLFCP